MGVPTWQPSLDEPGYQVDRLVDEAGDTIAMIEDFGYACYPSALNAVTGNKERGGAYRDRVSAMLWAERVAGLHPPKPEDERPAFYYGN